MKRVSPVLSYTPDIFEYVYFARPESTIDGISVHQSRQKLGVGIANAIKRELGSSVDEIDVVMAVPETSTTCALAAAHCLNKPYSQGLTKNRYVFRTFITPGQTQRRTNVARKLTAVKEEFQGRNVLIIDDSVVRGTTSREIIKIARDAGARKVFFASCSPPIRYTFLSHEMPRSLTGSRHNHIYGINLSKKENLVAYGRTTPEVCQELGCDYMIYLPLQSLVQACLQARNRKSKVDSFEVGVFTGDYITEFAGRLLGPILKRDTTKTSIATDLVRSQLGDELGLISVT